MTQHQSDPSARFALPAAGASGVVIGLIPAGVGGLALYLMFIGFSNNAPAGPLSALGIFGFGLVLVAALVLKGALVPPVIVTHRAIRVHRALGLRTYPLTDQSEFGWVAITRRSIEKTSVMERDAKRHYGRLFVKEPGQDPQMICFLPEPLMESLVSGIRSTTGLPVRKMPIGGHSLRGQPDPSAWGSER